MKRKYISRKIINIITVLIFVLPALIPLMVFWIFPMAESILMSFTDWDYMSSDYNFIGISNYINIFSSDSFFKSLYVTIEFAIGTIIPTLIGGLGIAVLLKKHLNGSSIYRAVIFSPWITPTVAVSIVWNWIFEPDYGLANHLLNIFNISSCQWLKSSDTALLGVIIVTVWKGLGWAMVFYLTALEKVPDVLYEAASVDGAGIIAKFIKVTIPLISPTTFFLTIITLINSLQAYDQIQVLTQGGPAGSTRTLLYYYYQTAFENFNIGEATAIASVMLIIIGGLSAIQFIASKRWVHY